jgi:hypothetical protein
MRLCEGFPPFGKYRSPGVFRVPAHQPRRELKRNGHLLSRVLFVRLRSGTHGAFREALPPDIKNRDH